ncbi:hypothetical protein LXL04_035964 [Taraxacum kok-saghyz]
MNIKVLLASETHAAQEWIVDCDQDEVDPEAQEETNARSSFKEEAAIQPFPFASRDNHTSTPRIKVFPI